MKNHYVIKKVRPDNTTILNNIMARSLAMWGYTPQQIEKAAEVLKITEEFLDKSVCYVAKIDDLIKGFFCIAPNRSEALSEAKFYIEPDSIRLGLGTKLWNKVIHELRTEEVRCFKFLIDPNAQGFYEKLGAIRIGEQLSDVTEGYMIPIMKYNITKNK